MSSFAVSIILTTLISLLSGFSVLFLNFRKKLNWFWFLYALALGAWSLGLFGVISSTQFESAWMWQYVLDIGGISIPILYLFFILRFLKIEEQYRWLEISAGIFTVFLLGLSFTDLFKQGLTSVAGFRFWIEAGPMYFLFPAFFAVLVLLSLIFLIRGYRQSENKVQKNQIQMFAISQMIGFAGGMTDFLPQLFGAYPVGNYLVAAYLLFVSYVVLRHRVFGFKAVATRLLLFVLWIIVFMRTFLSQSFWDIIVNLSVLVISLIIGGILIRVSQKEIEQRERAEELAEDLRYVNDQLEKLNEREKEFLSFASHQLKSPITSIKGYTSMLLEDSFGELSDSVREVVRKVFVSANSMRRAVDDFLNVSRIDQGRLEYEMEVFDLSKVVKEVISDLRSHATKKHLALKVKIDENEEHNVKADKEKMKQVVNNVVDNSIKYTEEGEVRVSLSKRIDEESGEEIVWVKVRDTGMGMSRKTINSLFQKYERAESVEEKDVSGTGLGLYIAKEMVEAQDGKIWAESEGEGEGSTFYVEMPGV